MAKMNSIAILVFSGMVFILFGFVYVVTPTSERVELLKWFGVTAVPAMIGGLPGLLAWIRAKSADKALNGTFDNRVKGLVHDALNERNDTVTVTESLPSDNPMR